MFVAKFELAANIFINIMVIIIEREPTGFECVEINIPIFKLCSTFYP